MRRLFLLAVLLLVPAAHAATGPTNGCPAPCSGQVSSPDGRRLLYVQPAGVGGPVHAYDPCYGRACVHAAARHHLGRRRSRIVSATARLRDTVVVPLPRRATRRPRTGWLSTAAGSSRASRRTDASPHSRGSPTDRRLTHVTVVNVFSGRIVHRLACGGTSRWRPSPATASGSS